MYSPKSHDHPQKCSGLGIIVERCTHCVANMNLFVDQLLHQIVDVYFLILLKGLKERIHFLRNGMPVLDDILRLGAQSMIQQRGNILIHVIASRLFTIDLKLTPILNMRWCACHVIKNTKSQRSLVFGTQRPCARLF